MELKEMIKVMQHYEKGGEVEIRFKDDKDDTWETPTDKHIRWNWSMYDYRAIKPKKKVKIEKWLYKNMENDYAVIESSSAVKYDGWKEIKLLETYEVEL